MYRRPTGACKAPLQGEHAPFPPRVAGPELTAIPIVSQQRVKVARNPTSTPLLGGTAPKCSGALHAPITIGRLIPPMEIDQPSYVAVVGIHGHGRGTSCS
jgi:hypothetical protein